MPRLRVVLIAVAVLAAGGCASDPIVDMKGVDGTKYQQDLAECRQYAEEVDVAGSAGTGAVVGAAAGAAVGAVVGAITGAPGTGAAIGAAGGGTSGLIGGGGRGYSKKQQVVRNCLRGRGYSVLD